MKFDQEYIEHISARYNKRHGTAFARQTANKRFLSPLGLTLDRIEQKRLKAISTNCTVLSSQEEFDLFAALHFIKYCMHKNSGSKQKRYLKVYLALRSRAICSNMGLVHNRLFKHSQQLSSGEDLGQLEGQGMIRLMSAVDHFDPWRGPRFSTYACTAINHSFYRKSKRSAPMEFYAELPEIITNSDSDDTDLWVERLTKILQTNVLTPVEKQIIKHRFDFGKHYKLQELGNMLGFTKETIRQKQIKALNKLKAALQIDFTLHFE